MKKQGFRITQSRRRLVADILSQKGHWTIHELTSKMRSTPIASIYRTVRLLRELNFLSESPYAGGSSRYEVKSSDHHDHLTCLDCLKIFEFENDQIERLQKQTAKSLGFRLADHRMELFGNCLKRKCPNRV